MDDNIYSATRGKYSHLNQVDYSKDELFKKFIKYIKGQQYGYTNLSFPHFQEISYLRFEQREVSVEIADSLSGIERTLSRESIKKLLSFDDRIDDKAHFLFCVMSKFYKLSIIFFKRNTD